MLLFSCPIVLIALVGLIAIHVASAFLGDGVSRILTYVNIVLHLLLLIPLMLYNFSIEESVLVYMISVFSYTVINFVKYKLYEKRIAKMPKNTDEAFVKDVTEEVSDDI